MSHKTPSWKDRAKNIAATIRANSNRSWQEKILEASLTKIFSRIGNLFLSLKLAPTSLKTLSLDKISLLTIVIICLIIFLLAGMFFMSL